MVRISLTLFVIAVILAAVYSWLRDDAAPSTTSPTPAPAATEPNADDVAATYPTAPPAPEVDPDWARVVSVESGEPINGAVVELAAAEWARIGGSRSRRVVTDELGRFPVSASLGGVVDLNIQAEGYALRRFVLTVPPGEPGRGLGDYALHGGVRVRGIVLGEDGDRVAGGRVFLRDRLPTWQGAIAPTMPGLPSVSLGADGVFEVWAEGPYVDFQVIVSGHASTTSGLFDVREVGDAPIEVRLSAGTTLHGQVFDRAGGPVGRATITLVVPSGPGLWVDSVPATEVTSAPDGRFVLPGIPTEGTYGVRAEATGYVPVEVTLEGESVPEPLELRLAPGMEFHVDLTSAGAPIGGTHAVLFLGSGSHVASLRFDGRRYRAFAVSRFPERGRIGVDGFEDHEVSWERDGADRVDLGVVELVNSAATTVEVYDERGRALDTARVDFVPWWAIEPDPSSRAVLPVDEQGRAAVSPHVGFGVMAPGYGRVWVAYPETPEPAVRRVVLERAASLTIRVVDVWGDPVVAADVWNRSAFRRIARTDARGETVLREAAPESEVQLLVHARGFIEQEEDVRVPGPGVSGEVEISLHHGATVVARATDEDGRPVSGVSVKVLHGVQDGERGLRYGGLRAQGRTDRSGRIELPTVVPGDYHVWWEDSGGLIAEEAASLRPGVHELHQVVPKAEEFVYRRRVIDDRGLPVEGARVDVFASKGGATRTNAKGEFELRVAPRERPGPLFVEWRGQRKTEFIDYDESEPIILEARATVSLALKDPAGRPLTRDIWLVVIDEHDRVVDHLHYRPTQGLPARFEGLPPGQRLRLIVDPPDYTVVDSSGLSQLVANEAREIVIELHERTDAQTLGVQLVGEDGRPLPEVLVEVAQRIPLRGSFLDDRSAEPLSMVHARDVLRSDRHGRVEWSGYPGVLYRLRITIGSDVHEKAYRVGDPTVFTLDR